MLTCHNRADDGLRTRGLQLGKLALLESKDAANGGIALGVDHNG